MFECQLISLIPCSKTEKYWKSANKIKFITWHRKLVKQVVKRAIIKSPVLCPFLVWAVHAILITLNDVNRTICISTTCYNGPRIQSKDRMSQWGRIRSNEIKINPGTYITHHIFSISHIQDSSNNLWRWTSHRQSNQWFIIRMFLFVP